MKIKPTEKPGNVTVELGQKDAEMFEKSAAPLFRLKRILVPVDFSECSRKALIYAVAFAKQFGASLILLHAVRVDYPVSEFGAPPAMDYQVLEEQLRENAGQEMRVLSEELIGGQVSASIIVRSGRPVQEIVGVARAENADLIIISTHGYTGLKHVMLGSTTENVIRYAPCPVLTVREQEHEFVTV